MYFYVNGVKVTLADLAKLSNRVSISVNGAPIIPDDKGNYNVDLTSYAKKSDLENLQTQLAAL